MGIKHEDTKTTGDKGYASEWNKDHVVDGNVECGQYQHLEHVLENRTDWPAGPVVGQVVYRIDTGHVHVWNGTVWVDLSIAGIDAYYFDDFLEADLDEINRWVLTEGGTGSNSIAAGVLTLQTGTGASSSVKIKHKRVPCSKLPS